jgi:hypothetical protein
MRLILVKLLALERSLTIAAGEAAWNVAWYAAWDTAWDATGDVAKNVAKKGKTPEEVANLACLSIMNSYDKILSSVDNLGTNIRHKENLDWNKTLIKLITFDDEGFAKLGLTNHRFKLFYFLRVHEIFSMLGNDELLTNFHQLLERTGDLECYNKLFLTDIPLELVETIVPRDVARIILAYSDSSVYNNNDVNTITSKLIGKID